MIISKRVYIKQLGKEHIPAYVDMFSTTVQSILGVSSIWSEYDYLHTQVKKQEDKKTWLYGIFECLQHYLIGSIEIRSPEHRGQLYTWMHEQYWGKGLFQEAFALVKQDYFLHNTQDNYFTAHVDKSNHASYKALCLAGCVVQSLLPGPREEQYYFKCYR